MPAWLEILVDFIGLAGFVAVATHASSRPNKSGADRIERDETWKS
jgi:hypothetical protein